MAVVTGTPFIVSFVVTFSTIVGVVPVATVTGASSTASIVLSTITAVSYTHLDVYKRQMLNGPSTDAVTSRCV